MAGGGGAFVSEEGPCSLARASPVTVALVDDDFDLLLDDGRRIALAGLEFPSAADAGMVPRRLALSRLSDLLVGEQVFLDNLASSPDRWGRTPAQAIIAVGSGPNASLASAGAMLLAEGLARFRPDPLAAPCAGAYLAAEEIAREQNLGVWASDPIVDVSANSASTSAILSRKKGMVVVSGTVQSVGETRSAIYLNFGPRRNSEFAIVISKRNMAIFAERGVGLRTLQGRRVRARGLIETNYGPRMEIGAPAEIEFLDAVQTR